MSAKTSASLWNKSLDNTGRAGETFVKSGGGFFPLHRLLRAHTAFLVMDNLVDLVRRVRRGERMPWSST